MKRRRLLLILCGPVLLLFAAGVWYAGNALAARQLNLSDAVRMGDVETIRYIGEWDPVQLTTPDSKQCLPICLAALEGNAASVAALLEHGVDPDEGLHCASTPEIAQMLIKAGADPNRLRGKVGIAPMSGALGLCPTIDMAKVFLDAGADPNGVSSGGFSVLDGIRDPALRNYLISRGALSNDFLRRYRREPAFNVPATRVSFEESPLPFVVSVLNKEFFVLEEASGKKTWLKMELSGGDSPAGFDWSKVMLTWSTNDPNITGEKFVGELCQLLKTPHRLEQGTVILLPPPLSR